MSELSIISQKAGPLGEKKNPLNPAFGDFAGGGNVTKSANNMSMGLEDDVTGQSLLGKIPSPLAPMDLGGSKLEYPADVSGNAAYVATVRFQVMEYTVATSGKSQKNHISGTTDNSKAEKGSSAKVEKDNSDFAGTNTLVADNSDFAGGNAFVAPDVSDFAGTNSFGADVSDFAGTNTFKDASTEFKEITKDTTSSGGTQLGFFPKKKSPKVVMYFPLSQTFVDGVAYGDTSLGLAGASALGAAEAGKSGVGAAIDAAKGSTANIIDTFLRGDLRLAGVAKTEAARLAVANSLGKAPLVGGAAKLINRITVNPNVRKLFNGVAIRDFVFQFKLIATSPEEGEAVQQIIKYFRQELYPKAYKVPVGGESSVSLGYNFPNAFKIKFYFKDSENKNIPKILPCYLRSISHTINPTGGSFRNDGKANEIDLTLSFVEYRAIEQQDIQEGY